MKKTNKRYIIWDLDGTLWTHKWYEVVVIADALNIPHTPILEDHFFEMIEEFNKIFSDRIVIRDEIPFLIEKTIPELFFYGISGEQFLNAWSKSETNLLNEHARFVLREAVDKGYKNIVLTDWLYDRQMQQLNDFGILDYFKKVYSAEGHYMKGNPKSVARVINEKKKDAYILIGDSLKSDIAFANNAGIDSIWYNPKHSPNTTEFVPTYEVDNLKSAMKLISLCN